jgi:hypothetical protein
VTANLIETLLLSPLGTLTNWDGYLHWTGLTGVDTYWIEVYDGAGARILETYYTPSVCSGLNCAVAPAELANLANGSYRWRIRTYTRGVGYSAWTPDTYFTLNLP